MYTQQILRVYSFQTVKDEVQMRDRFTEASFQLSTVGHLFACLTQMIVWSGKQDAIALASSLETEDSQILVYRSIHGEFLLVQKVYAIVSLWQSCH